ncbi:hypothetical protein [Pontibacter harenae]|uniref:hypothetical protein n=1 Tax=Pontibacter harenae TaxID=2894083 RepID=UPI001E42B180|nr:hypothetical protein [Pontibacter harenae]MCC9168025.1 hypothetical protein [Pontibacter harenae]
MVCYQSEYLHVEYYDSTQVLLTQWYGGCSSLQYRQALIKSIRLSKKLQVKYAVIDKRLLPPLSKDDFEWTLNLFMDALKKLPFKRYAIINAYNPTAAHQQQKLYYSQRKNLDCEIKTFDDLTSAYDWLTATEEA